MIQNRINHSYEPSLNMINDSEAHHQWYAIEMILVPRPSGGSPEVVQPAKYTGGEIRMARLEPELSKPGDLGIFFFHGITS